MTTFDDRENAAEAKFAHDEAQHFRLQARRAKHVGIWAAGLLGLTGAQAEAYATSLVVTDFEEAGDEDMLRKLRADFAQKGVAMDEAGLRREMDAALVLARADLGAPAPRD